MWFATATPARCNEASPAERLGHDPADEVGDRDLEPGGLEHAIQIALSGL